MNIAAGGREPGHRAFLPGKLGIHPGVEVGESRIQYRGHGIGCNFNIIHFLHPSGRPFIAQGGTHAVQGLHGVEEIVEEIFIFRGEGGHDGGSGHAGELELVKPGADFLAQPSHGVAGVLEFSGCTHHAVKFQLQQLPGFHIGCIIGNAFDECLRHRGDIDRFLAEIPVPVRQQVGIVRAEYAHGFAVAGIQPRHARFPGGMGFKGFDIPGVVSHAEETHLACFGMFHGVGYKAAHLVAHFGGGIKPVGAPHGKPAALKVIAWPVPPDKSRPLHMFIYPFLAGERDIMHHGVSRPHHRDAFIEPAAQCLEEFLVGPAAVVAGGAHDEGLVYIRVLADEVFQQVISQLHLAFRLAYFPAGIIHQNAEIPYAQLIHLPELVTQGIELVSASVFVPLDRIGRVDGPHETNTILPCVSDQFTQFCGLFCRVGLIAAAAMVIGIILGSIDIEVHLVASHETEDGAAGFKAPWCAVVAFDYSAPGQIRPVYQNTHGKLSQTGYFTQGFIGKHIVMRQCGIWYIVEHLDDRLAGVVHAHFIIGIDGQFTGGDIDGIPFGHIGQAVPHAAPGVRLSVDDLHISHPRGDRAHAIVLRVGVDDNTLGGLICCEQGESYAAQRNKERFELRFHISKFAWKSASALILHYNVIVSSLQEGKHQLQNYFLWVRRLNCKTKCDNRRFSSD